MLPRILIPPEDITIVTTRRRREVSYKGITQTSQVPRFLADAVARKETICALYLGDKKLSETGLRTLNAFLKNPQGWNMFFRAAAAHIKTGVLVFTNMHWDYFKTYLSLSFDDAGYNLETL